MVKKSADAEPQVAEGSGTILQFISPPADELQKLRDNVAGKQSRIRELEGMLLGARQSTQTITDEGGGIDGMLEAVAGSNVFL